ncbi:MAG TPA: (Fe-S)-binding protein, partial [Longimicrobiales bacterium]|nr:(Fe-S)-binding protein [Longimicrobiales bacterium]
MLENVTGVTELCRHCLMCRHMCPVGNITRLETLTPHGWGQLVALEKRGLSTWNERTVDALYKCADCGSCRNHCVYSNPLPDGIAATRAAIVEKGMAPSAVLDVAQRLREWGNPYERRQPDAPTGAGEVALFVGDEAQYLRPAVLEAALTLLRAVGIEPALIGRGRSNGF